MKRIIPITTTSLLILSSTLAGASLFPARVVIRVSDDDGAPIAGTEIHAKTNHSWMPGEGFGRIIEHERRAITDSNGIASIQIECRAPRIHIGSPAKSGFYYTQWKVVNLSKVENGRWEPWDHSVDFVLKSVRNPIPLYARKLLRVDSNGISEYNVPMGFDLVVGDWVKPWGQGISSDMYFTLLEHTPTKNGAPPFHYVLRLTFPNSQDGIQSFPMDLSTRSELRLPRFAPTIGYAATWESSLRQDDTQTPISATEDSNMNYFFRIRTRIDDSGEIKSALYGKIYGDISFGYRGQISMTYYLNPTPLDRNLEFDLKRNLFKGLPSFEGPREP